MLYAMIIALFFGEMDGNIGQVFIKYSAVFIVFGIEIALGILEYDIKIWILRILHLDAYEFDYA